MSTSFGSEFESFDSSIKNDSPKKIPINGFVDDNIGDGDDYNEDLAESTHDYITKKGNDEIVMESIDKINELLDWNDQISNDISIKFQNLENVNKDFEIQLTKLQNQINNKSLKQGHGQGQVQLQHHTQLKEPNFVKPKIKSYLPTPEDEEYLEKKIEFEFGGGISRQNQSTPNLSNLPSSPELDLLEPIEPIRTNGSEVEEIEMELNDKISRLVQKDYNNPNIQKLRNIVGSTFELLKFEELNDATKLMNFNEELRYKSGGLINKLYGLVDSFT